MAQLIYFGILDSVLQEQTKLNQPEQINDIRYFLRTIFCKFSLLRQKIQMMIYICLASKIVLHETLTSSWGFP